jgi:hypothetical protein
LQVHWLARCIKYWNKLVTNRAQSSLLMTVLIANVHHVEDVFKEAGCKVAEGREQLLGS